MNVRELGHEIEDSLEPICHATDLGTVGNLN